MESSYTIISIKGEGKKEGRDIHIPQIGLKKGIHWIIQLKLLGGCSELDTAKLSSSSNTGSHVPLACAPLQTGFMLRVCFSHGDSDC